MHRNLFSSEVELSKFLGSIDIIPDAYRGISRTSGDYQLHTSPSGIQILAFNCPGNDYTARVDLVSSKTHTSVDFISTKDNQIFSINKDAVELFEQIIPDDIEIKVKLDGPLIITGQGLGGYPAIIFALWLQNVIDVKESNGSKNSFKRPICITFGSPLVGDEALQRAIAERPQWKSSFLNVVAKKDSIASLFSSNSEYKPFGTFMFCTESGGHSAFEDQESIIAVLDVMESSNDGNMEMYDYENVLSSIEQKILYRGECDHFGGLNMNPWKAGLLLQFKEVDVPSDISNDLIEKLETKRKREIKNEENAYEPTKSLYEMKISLTYMEWYMKTREPKGGYYDCYKNTSKKEISSHQVITTHKRRLNQYWRKTVEQANLMPQKEGAKLRKRWLYGGTNYRRIVEPLDIAEYYKNGFINYIKHRPEHYTLLEKWLNEEKKDSNTREERRTKAASLTEDSCFWARVEEALILLKNLKNGGSSDNAADIKELETFEDNLMRAINNYFMSPTIFLEGSSLMMWWKEYKEYKGGSYASDFAHYMNNKIYLLYENGMTITMPTREIKNKKNAYVSTMNKNEMRVSLMYMEWYMKYRAPKGGYYDCYKNATSKEESTIHQEIIKHKRTLNQYWRTIVEEKNLMPQKEGAKLGKLWLNNATNYRRIVEPLDIAEYYRNGNINYIDNRPEHYNLLESWSNEDQKNWTLMNNMTLNARPNKLPSLTLDSCFWAYVEEAVISLRVLEEGGSSNSAGDITHALEVFETNLHRMLAGIRSNWIQLD